MLGHRALQVIDIQRATDGAFFEDWSPWASLGGWPSHISYPVGHRPTNMPCYHCTLQAHSEFAGGPAFEVAIPQDRRAIRLIEAIPGARLYPRSGTRMGPVEIWFVPARSWRQLRVVLPAIARVVSDVVTRQ